MCDRLNQEDRRIFQSVDPFGKITMSNDQEDDMTGMVRQRATREEVRKKNREVMARANAELREGKAASGLGVGSSSGKKEVSRLAAIRQSRTGSGTFWTPFEFHNSTPELSIGPVRLEINVDETKFTEFNRDNVAGLYNECLKSTCLVDDLAFVYLDLVNPEEAHPDTSGGIDPLDEPLLSNEASTLSESRVDGISPSDGVYTGHFLRKPQLMSNDLFTEGDRKVGSSKFSIPSDAKMDSSVDEFDLVKKLDEQFANGEPVFNPITKSTIRPKRVLSLLPDTISGDIIQFKFEDKGLDSSRFKLLLNQHLALFENTEVDSSASCDTTPVIYRSKRRFVQTNKSAPGTGASDEFYLITMPADATSAAYLLPVGNKVLLKRDTAASVEPTEIRLTKA